MLNSPVPCSVYNNQDYIELNPDWLKKIPSLIEQYIWKEVSPHQLPASVLHEIHFLEIAFIDDISISQAHADFMDDPTPTDVITFLHGELLISVETAQRQAKEHQQDLYTELLRYIIHGVLHLAGYTDYEIKQQQTMISVQESILQKILIHFTHFN